MKPKAAKKDPIMTQEMADLLGALDPLVDCFDRIGKKPPFIRMNPKQWECLQKDRAREEWKQPRSCGLFHHGDGSSEYRNYHLVPEDVRADWRPGEQIDAFDAQQSQQAQSA